MSENILFCRVLTDPEYSKVPIINVDSTSGFCASQSPYSAWIRMIVGKPEKWAQSRDCLRQRINGTCPRQIGDPIPPALNPENIIANLITQLNLQKV